MRPIGIVHYFLQQTVTQQPTEYAVGYSSTLQMQTTRSYYK